MGFLDKLKGTAQQAVNPGAMAGETRLERPTRPRPRARIGRRMQACLDRQSRRLPLVRGGRVPALT
jgi:hypothetical protein